MSPVELIDAHIERIEAVNPEINAVVLPHFEQAREEAREAEQAVQRGDSLGPLHGVPYTAKEPIEVAGMACNDASKIFEGNVSTEDAVVVQSLRAAGAILLGKTNVPEFALHYDSNNAVYGATGNPHDRTRTAGGSSGGEAAALVTGMSPFGVGSDYGGSIRIPANFCGCVGIKPGRYVVPRAGHFPPAQPLTVQQWSVIGPMARCVEDLELLLPIFARPDRVRDPDCGPSQFTPVDGSLRVALFWEDGVRKVEPEVREAVEAAGKALAGGGHEVVERRPPLQAEARELFRQAALGEIAAGLAPLVGERRDELSPQMQVIFDTLVDHADTSLEGYVGRLLFEAEIERQLAAWQAEHPIAVAPISPCPAFPLGADNVEVCGEQVPMIELMSFSTYVNQTGVPAASVPIAKSAQGLPIGVQVIGRRGHEMEVLAVAKKLEQAFGGWIEPPK